MRAARTLPAAQQAEISRTALWPLTPRSVRAAILMIAGFSRDRAGDSLHTFSASERERIYLAAQRLSGDAGIIAQCAQPAMLVAH
jgi:hypothetical protein